MAEQLHSLTWSSFSVLQSGTRLAHLYPVWVASASLNQDNVRPLTVGWIVRPALFQGLIP